LYATLPCMLMKSLKMEAACFHADPDYSWDVYIHA